MEEISVRDCHTISMGGSKLNWDDVDKRARNIGFKERSKYIQYLVEKDIYKGKINLRENLVIILLLILAVTSLTILLKIGV